MDCVFSLCEFYNVVIGGVIIGLIVSVLFVWLSRKFERHKLRNDFSFLESPGNKFDWQHWNIKHGAIADEPEEAYMNLKYREYKTFSFRWTEKGSNDVKGEGFIFWNDLTHGKMSFYAYQVVTYNYRNVFYRKIEHQGKIYDAIL